MTYSLNWNGLISKMNNWSSRGRRIIELGRRGNKILKCKDKKY